MAEIVAPAVIRNARSSQGMRCRLFSLVKRRMDSRRDRILRIRGLMRLYSLAYRILKPKGPVLATAQNVKIFVNTLDDIMAPWILAYGIHEEYETELFSRLVKPSMVVLDIGANIGYYTLIAAGIVGAKGRVYAFEPDPANHDLLVSSVGVNGFTNVVASRVALGCRREMGRLFRDKVNWGAHSLSAQNVSFERAGAVEVEVVKLDEFLEGQCEQRVDFIKMDVEGAEGLVLQGADRTLRHNRPMVLMEFWPAGLRNLGCDPLEVLAKLGDYGFKTRVLLDGSMVSVKSASDLVSIAEDRRYVNLYLEK